MAQRTPQPDVHRFSGAPVLDAAAVRATRRLTRLLPAPEDAAALRRALEAALANLQGPDASTPGSDATLPLLHVEPIELATQRRTEGVQVRAYLRSDHGPVVCEAPLEATRSVVHRVLGMARDAVSSDLLTELERGVLGYFLDPLVLAASETLGAAGPTGIRTLGCETGPIETEGDDPAACWSGTVRLAGLMVPFRIVVSPRVLRAIGEAARSGATDPARWTARLATARVRFAAILARASLPASEVARLQPGDVVVFAASGVSLTDDGEWRGSLELRATGRGAAARILVRRAEPAEGEGREEEAAGSRVPLVIESLLGREAAEVRGDEPEVESVAANTPEGAAAGGPDSGGGAAGSLMRDLPVVVRIELGQLTLTVGQIAELRAGDILELGVVPGEPVALMVEDRRIGRGEIVRVDGELGVRIRELA